MAKYKYYVVWEGRARASSTRGKSARSRSRSSWEPNTRASTTSNRPPRPSAKPPTTTSGFCARSASTRAKSSLPPHCPRPSLPTVWPSMPACSGNPGHMEYRGVDTKSGIELFHVGPLPQGTNNIGEFLALVHGLAYLQQRGSQVPIYSDSRNAITWVRQKKVQDQADAQRRQCAHPSISLPEPSAGCNPIPIPIPSSNGRTEQWGRNPGRLRSQIIRGSIILLLYIDKGCPNARQPLFVFSGTEAEGINDAQPLAVVTTPDSSTT